MGTIEHVKTNTQAPLAYGARDINNIQPVKSNDNTQQFKSDCSVCLQRIEPLSSPSAGNPKANTARTGDAETLVFKCGHGFHRRCAATWLALGDLSCPNCRCPIDLGSEKFQTTVGVTEVLLENQSTSKALRSQLLTALGEIAVKNNESEIPLNRKKLKPFEVFHKSLRIDPTNIRAAVDLAIMWPKDQQTLRVRRPGVGDWITADRAAFARHSLVQSPDNDDLKFLSQNLVK